MHAHDVHAHTVHANVMNTHLQLVLKQKKVFPFSGKEITNQHRWNGQQHRLLTKENKLPFSASIYSKQMEV
jgi:hypothetical protein